jgi:signal transduction histidine kinase
MEHSPVIDGKPGGLGARLGGLSPEALRWTLGFFCAFIGAFVLVAPHHFGGRPYVTLHPYTAVWGILLLLAGVFLLAVSIFRPRRWVAVAVHGMAGAALLALGVSFASSGAWSGMISYVVLGLGTAVAGFLSRSRPAGGGDLFALLMGVLATMVGSLMVAAPDLMRGSFAEFSWNYVTTLGALLALSGPLLVWAQLRPGLPSRQVWEIHLLAGLAFVSFAALASLPLRAWTGMALYLGGGASLAVQPWLRRRLGRIDTAALRIRLALTLATATSLALILATAVVTTQEERLAEVQVRATQEIEAAAIAQNVADYVALNGTRAFAVAALSSQAAMGPEDQLRLLLASQESYRDVAGFRTLDARGRVVAGTGPVGLPPRLLARIAAEIQVEPRIQLRLVNLGERPLLLLSAPVRRRPDEVSGVVVAVFDSESLGQRIVRPGSSVHLADGHGFQIAHRDTLDGGPLPRLPSGWDERVRAGQRIKRRRGLIATAVVPGLGWVVAVERPRAAALAGVRRGRDSAFLLLLLVIPLAVIGGIYAARRIARPLGTLAGAVGQIGLGNLGVPVEASGITEVSHLSTAFSDMRDRLAARTRESERLAAELRARAEALAESDRRKDEFLAMLAHELRNPLGAISNASYLMEQLRPAEPQMARSVAIIRRQILHLVRMVDDLLDVSRITRGKVELRKEPVDLVEVVRHAAETTRPLFEEKGHELLMTLPAGPLSLEADVTRLEQVLANLFRNAAKYTEPGGRIEVAVLHSGGEMVVRVRDNGVGISPDLLPRVFDLFAQGEQSLDRSGGGLGIGLTLVRSLVEMHGGRVEAQSDGAGKGSEFVVRLPAVEVRVVTAAGV